MKLKAALLVDNLQLNKWQLDALDTANNSIEIVLILNCQNTRNKKSYLKNFLYYALNYFTLKNHLTKRQSFSLPNVNVVNFKSMYKGAWQSLPEIIYKEIESGDIDVVIKFGMSLLRLNEERQFPPILSYHHGDPSKYRGRPAGFYEILNNEKTMGIIVQSLNNKLDAGEIYAFAESKVVNFSYKKTALNFYSNSTPLLDKAIKNLSNKSRLEVKVDGKNYRLPSNTKVISFLFVIILNAFKKVVYGLFFEKRWKVATTKNSLSFNKDEELSSMEFSEVPIDKKYNFYADPFYSEDSKKIRLEALDNRTGLGDILELEGKDYSNKKVLISGRHFSYPCSFVYQGKEYLLLEVASHSAQYFFEANKVDEKHYLKGLEYKRIVDATLHLHDGKCFLFFGEKQSAHTILNLWTADTPFDLFKPHPMNPIVISPSVARMGGKLLSYRGKILRFGQNNSGEYGESIEVIQITTLSVESYDEVRLGTLKIDNFRGPHSVSFNSDMSEILVDYYSNKFSLFAGVRRIKSRLQKK